MKNEVHESLVKVFNRYIVCEAGRRKIKLFLSLKITVDTLIDIRDEISKHLSLLKSVKINT